MTYSLAAAVNLGTFVSNTSALDPSSTDAEAIIQASAKSQQPARSISRMKMTIHEGSDKRERVFTMRTRRYPDARKILLLLEAPADLRNTGFLSVSYSQAAKSDEQWIYLPKLKRVSRVASSGKADSFMGSDFSISDLSLATQDAGKYKLKMVDPLVKVGQEECWLIESTPRTEAIKNEVGYSQIHIWVSKSKLAVLQLKGWMLDGKRTKYFRAVDFKSDNGVWTSQRMQMKTMSSDGVASETSMEVLSVDNAAEDVTDADFTEQRLEQGV
jgi:hypothetical protein